jgi:hypothetical protein
MCDVRGVAEVVPMDFTEAITAHTRWRIRLFRCIRGQAELPDAPEVARDDVCELGRWLEGAGKEYVSLAEFRETRSAHATFHLRAAEVVSAAEGGEKDQAEAMLRAGTPYGVASEALILALTKLGTVVRKAGDGSRQA